MLSADFAAAGRPAPLVWYLALLALTMVIQFVLGAVDPAYNQLQHYLWMMLLLMLAVRGPGVLSLDAWLERRFAQSGA